MRAIPATLLLAWACLSVSAIAAFAEAPAAAAPRCGDPLAEMQRKPDHVVFVDCRYLRESQGKPLRSTYRVEGRFAAKTEAYLVRHLGLKRLRRACCHWDAPAGTFKDAKGAYASITMVSDETGARSRAAWPTIPVFEITVDVYTEEI